DAARDLASPRTGQPSPAPRGSPRAGAAGPGAELARGGRAGRGRHPGGARLARRRSRSRRRRLRTPPGGARLHAAASLRPACRGRRGRGALPDRVRAPAGFGGGADGGPPFDGARLRAAGSAGRRGGAAGAPRGGRHVPSGERRGLRRARHALGGARGLRRARRAHRAGAGAQRARRGDRDDRGAGPRGRGGSRSDRVRPPLRWGDSAADSTRIPVPRGRRLAHEFPHAPQHAAGPRLRVRRQVTGARGVPGCDRGAVPVPVLRRRDVVAGASVVTRYEPVARSGAARAGLLPTRRGVVPTPAFMPVGGSGGGQALDPTEGARTGARMVIMNTYHLWLRPGPEVVAELGGLHEMSRWPHVIATDSGGFQAFSLAERTKVDEEGVEFASHL